MIRKDIEQNIQRLEKVVDKGTEFVNYFYTTSKTSVFRDKLITVIASVVMVLIVSFATLFIFANKLTLTHEELVTYNHGKHFETFWYKLSLAEQKRLDDIASGKATLQTAIHKSRVKQEKVQETNDDS